MTWIFIEPSDVWFFRDGRPFDAGEGHTVRSIFPPTPFTMQGAIRSLILGHADVSWRAFARQDNSAAQELGEKIGYPADRSGRAAALGDFSIAGPFIARKDQSGAIELLTPLPADAGYRIDESWQAMRPRSAPFGQNTNSPAQPLHPLIPADPALHNDTPPKETGFIDRPALESYLQGETFSVAIKTPVHLAEPRLGIAIDYAVGRAQDQMLYNAEFIRLREQEPYGLAVQLGKGVTLPQQAGVMALGGEARGAQFETLEDSKSPPVFQQPQSLRFKILTLTPAWFSDGWQPAGGDWASFFGVPANVTVTCIAVALGRPGYIGGWDVANNKQKPLRAFVPPASVYYFETSALATLPDAFTETPPNELSFAAQGFGAYAGGTWAWAAQPQ